jgi:protein-S-isoprenylcysteine O-methyltransferase Ste14
MRDWPAGLIDGLWIIWALYWLFAARSVKPVRRREPLSSRLSYVLPALLGSVLLVIGHRGPQWLQIRLIGGGWTRLEIAVALIVAGLSFSVWARRSLGSNWSGAVTVKVDHQLVQSGPYRRVRHPIYTGLLVAIFGSGLAAGRLYGTIGFILISVSLVVKLRVEERWMAAEFAERYEQYRRSSWALIPFVF